MKKLIIFFLLIKSIIFFGQENKITNKNPLIENNTNQRIIVSYPSLKNSSPIFYINNIKTDWQSFIIKENNILEVSVFKGKKAIFKKGINAKNGLVIIKTKPNIQLLNLQSFYTEYKISKIDQLLPIVLNKHFVDEKEYLLLDKSAIVSVKILDEQPFVEPVLLPRGKAIYIEAMEMK